MDPVLVKLVSGHYGEEVHKLLAKANLAPEFFSSSILPHANKAYAMEYLKGTWRSTWELKSLSRYKEPIENALEEALVLLEQHEMVHGDLRENNIMIQMENEYSSEPKLVGLEKKKVVIRIIDFDWADHVGVAKYPHMLNTGIIWPGRPGMPIGAGDDRKMVKRYLNSL
jgi:serine/threonine protein kinase